MAELRAEIATASVVAESTAPDVNDGSIKVMKSDESWQPRIHWRNVALYTWLHVTAAYGLYLILTGQAMVLTVLWGTFLYVLSLLGTTMGAHRLYAHKAYKATPLLRLMLVLMHTMTGQKSVWMWAAIHRQHHKFADTPADPHNSGFGMFFSHMGWVLTHEHPEVVRTFPTIDMSDVNKDSIVMFQKKYYKPMYFLVAFAMPVAVPYYLWGEGLVVSIAVAYSLRYALSLHSMFSVNSFAHKYGSRPYTQSIPPAQIGLVSFFMLGEGWHNYHHTFPWDYRAAEFGEKFNLSTTMIDLCARLGLAYDLRSATPDMVKHRILKQGDGSHVISSVTKYS